MDKNKLVDQHLADLSPAMAKVMEKLDAQSSRLLKLDEIHPVVLDFKEWRPSMEHTVETLRAEVTDLRMQVLAINTQTPTHDSSTLPAATHLPDPVGEGCMAPHLGEEGHGPIGHRVIQNPRGLVFGEFTAPRPAPAKSTETLPSLISSTPFGSGSSSWRSNGDGYRGNTPRMDCPMFDGENPMAWRMKCESYFRACGVHRDVWVNVAVMQFTRAAALWLQCTSAHLQADSWETFAQAVCGKFGRREFQHQLRQFSHPRQTGCHALFF